MNPKSEILEPEDSVEEATTDATPSVDDFIRELKLKRKICTSRRNSSSRSPRLKLTGLKPPVL